MIDLEHNLTSDMTPCTVLAWDIDCSTATDSLFLIP